MKRTLNPRCMATNNSDGLQCSRRVAAKGDSLCAVHLGKTNSPIIPSGEEPVDALRLLKRLARSRNESVSLRAVDLLLEVEKAKTKPVDVPRQTAEAFLDVLTDDERAHVTTLTQQFQALREQVWMRHPELRPAHFLRPATAEPRETAPEPAPIVVPVAPTPPETRGVEIDGVRYLDLDGDDL